MSYLTKEQIKDLVPKIFETVVSGKVIQITAYLQCNALIRLKQLYPNTTIIKMKITDYNSTYSSVDMIIPVTPGLYDVVMKRHLKVGNINVELHEKSEITTNTLYTVYNLPNNKPKFTGTYMECSDYLNIYSFIRLANNGEIKAYMKSRENSNKPDQQ